MKIKYNAETQELIEHIQNRMKELSDKINKDLNTASEISVMEVNRMRNGFVPSVENEEYRLLAEKLSKIYETWVPRYLLSQEEYNMLKGENHE